MAKWLVGGGVAIIAMLILLWLQMRPDAARPVALASPAPASPPQVALAAAPPAPAAAAAEPAAAAPSAAAPDDRPARLDPKSDEFFYKFDEVVPSVLTRNAAKCYEGRHGQLHRNQKLSLRFKTKVVNGEVTVHDVTIKESTLGDPALETCFIQEVQRSTWKDDELPDWQQDDELVLRPERGMKKFWRDNVDYAGAEAPRQ